MKAINHSRRREKAVSEHVTICARETFCLFPTLLGIIYKFLSQNKHAGTLLPALVLASLGLLSMIGLVAQIGLPGDDDSAGSTLAVWYQLDEGAGTIATDASGHGDDGLLMGQSPPLWITNGIAGSALEFDGSGESFVVAPGHVTISNELTLSVWVRTSPRENGVVLDQSDSGGSKSGYSLWILGGYPSLRLTLDGSKIVVTSKSALDDDGEWHHIAAVYDGKRVRVYLDGKLTAKRAAEGAVDAADSPLLLGASADGDGFLGDIDDVRIYNSALSARAIRSLYNLDTDGDGIPNRRDRNPNVAGGKVPNQIGR